MDKAAILSTSLVSLGLVWCKLKRNEKKKRKHSCWVKEWVKKRPKLGINATLLQELKIDEPELYCNYLRMDQDTFVYLLEKVRPLITKQNVVREPISAEDRLIITLRFLATGESFKSLQFASRIPQCSISKIVPETCNAIYEALKDEYLKVPNTEIEWLSIAEDYYNQWQVANTIGALDGKHIRIQCPPSGGSHYFNYKGFHSVILLALCDANYKFIAIDAGTNGRVGDAGVYSKSKIKTCLLNKSCFNIPRDKMLPETETSLPLLVLADDAFPLSHTIMKPYALNGITKDEKIFNYRLSRGRRMIESSFGILATRFRIFLTTINLSPKKVTKITMTCCALHNMLVDRRRSAYTSITHPNRDGFAEPVSTEVFAEMIPLQAQSDLGAGRYGKEIRDKLKNYYNTIGAVPWQDSKIV